MDDSIRCKFFDDDGNPINNGCRFGSRCRYIHPSDPIWNTTMPYKGRRLSDRPKDERIGRHVDSGWPSRDQLRRDSHSHRKEISPGWGALDSRPLTSNSAESHTPTDSAGGSLAWGWGDGSKETIPASGEAPNSWVEGSTGWGTGGWGDSTKAGNSKSGETPNPWGGDSTGWAAGGWGTGGWGGGGSDKAKFNEPEPAFSSAHSMPNSPSILSNSPPISRMPKPDGRQSSGLERPKTSLSPEITASPITAGPTIKRARLPLPTRIGQGTTATSSRETTDNKHVSSPSPATPQDWTSVPLSTPVAGRLQQDDAASDASGPISVLVNRDPKELYSKLVKEMVCTVLVRYELLKAEERKDRWRKARQSSCYQHSTPAAQKILESTNHKFSDELAKLNKQLNSSLKKILRYYDALNAHRDLFEKGFDTEAILIYTEELRNWIADLELPKRIFAAVARMDREKQEREAVKQRREMEVASFRNAVYELELKVTDVSDGLDVLRGVQPEYFQKALVATRKALEEWNLDVVPDLEGVLSESGVEAVKESTKAVDQRILDHRPKINDLRVCVRALEDEVEDLRQKDREITGIQKEVTSKLEQMENWKRTDKDRLDQLSQKVEGLCQQPQMAPLPYFTANDLAPYINVLITKYVASEISPALDAIAAIADLDGTVGFNQLVEKVVVKTYDLVQKVLTTSGLAPQVDPQLCV